MRYKKKKQMPSDSTILRDLMRNLKDQQSDPLAPLIDEYFLTRHRSKRRLEALSIDLRGGDFRPAGRLSPSSIGACMRKAAFGFLGVPKKQKHNPQLQRTFDRGNWIHYQWQARLQDMELVLGSDRFKVKAIEQVANIPELFISGHYDALIWIADFGKLLIDVKSINHWGFHTILRTNKPNPQNKRQIISYNFATKVRHGVLLYDDKSNEDYNHHFVEFDKKEFKKIKRWCLEVIEHLEQTELPEMHADCDTKSSQLAKSCPWAHICYSDHSDKQIEKAAYKNFVGVEKMWELGQEADRERKAVSRLPRYINRSNR